MFGRFLKEKLKTILFFAIVCVISLASFLLYHLPLKAVLYPLGICLVLGILFLIIEYSRVKSANDILEAGKKLQIDLMKDMPPSDGVLSQDYQDIIKNLLAQQKQFESDATEKYNSMIEYYTLWAHQIKTPIAAMRLTLQNEDTEVSRRLKNDLSRIEQYVEMVLSFLRLDSNSTDYIIKEYDLDGIIKSSVKRFAGEFILKKLSLEYEDINYCAITDEKWISLVIEQVLSNAVKYTKEGSVSIYFEEPDTLCIKDTGIGIASSDLPRIFDNGYTGFNGRSDKKASGIGLYLCKMICDKLGHKISVESMVGSGTVVRISFGVKTIGIE